MPGQEERAKLTASALAKAYHLIGYQALGIGDADLAAGADWLRNLSKNSKFYFISANLTSKSGQATLFPPAVILPAGSLKVGIIALTGPAAASPGYQVRPWQEALPGLLAKTAKKSDLIILLSELPLAETKAVVTTYPAIRIVIQGGPPQSSPATTPQSRPSGSTPILSVAPEGRQLGVLDIDWRPGRPWAPQELARLTAARTALAQTRSELKKLSPRESPPPGSTNPARQALTARELALEAAIKELSDKLGPANLKAGFSTYVNRTINLDASLPEDQAVKAITERLDAGIQAPAAGKAPARPGP